MLDELRSAAQEQGGPGRRFSAPVLALLFLGAVAAYVLLNSAFFRVERVTVTGNRSVDVARLQEIAGVALGDLRWVHPADAVARRLRSEAWIRDAQVAWKPGELAIAVTEREAVGMVPYHTAFLLVDETGVVLQQVPSLTSERLPVITGVPVERTLRGVKMNDQGLHDALYLLSWMAEPLRSSVGEINVDEKRNLTFYMQNITVMWGRLPGGSDREHATKTKLAAFGAYAAEAKESKEPVCYIDFRDAKQAYIGCKEKPAGSAAN